MIYSTTIQNYFIKFLLNDANSSSSTSSIDKCLCNFGSGEASVEVDCVDTDAASLTSDATDSLSESIVDVFCSLVSSSSVVPTFDSAFWGTYSNGTAPKK